MDENLTIDQDRIMKINIEEEMKTSYIDYSMSVIVARALPDVRDGFKPVHRRILYGMLGLGNTSDKPYKKCARVVGEVLGKYHPHGDSSVYGALVRMGQEWNMRYKLVDGQGNFGSVDGDSPAAMRYTECRLSKMGEHIMDDIDKDTVDFVDNFDGEEKEDLQFSKHLFISSESSSSFLICLYISPVRKGDKSDSAFLSLKKCTIFASDKNFILIDG